MRMHALDAQLDAPNGTCVPICLLTCSCALTLQYWKRMRAPDAQLGSVDGTGTTFLQTAAEKLDVPDNSQDIV